jgi:hypothetical protein
LIFLAQGAKVAVVWFQGEGFEEALVWFEGLRSISVEFG